MPARRAEFANGMTNQRTNGRVQIHGFTDENTKAKDNIPRPPQYNADAGSGHGREASPKADRCRGPNAQRRNRSSLKHSRARI